MCFSRFVLDRIGWGSTSLTEDLDQSLTLFEHGVKIFYDPLAVNNQYMPPTLAAAAEQRQRWSAGEAEAGKTRLLAMFIRAVKEQNFKDLLQTMYLLAPPFSLNLLAAGITLGLTGIVTWLDGPLWPLLLAMLLFVLHAGYFLLGTSEVGFSRLTIQAVAMIPVFAIWRVIIHAMVVVSSKKRALLDWKRTPRV